MAAAVVGNPGDIYMIFDKGNPTNLKSIGTLSATLNDTSIGSIPNVTDLAAPDTKITQEKLFNSINKSTPIAPNDSVIVKLANSSSDKFLYIPGVVTDATGGSYTINIGEGTTITNVEEKDITKNRQLKKNEKGWFFSDSVLASFIKDGGVTKTMLYKDYVAKIDDILDSVNNPDNYRVITCTAIMNTAGSDTAYTINKIELGTPSKEITEVKAKSVVPFIYNQSDILETKINPLAAITVFGGKKSKKPNTRKNTMPLQYAPGAKRAYLKRRKSSRK